MSYIKKRSEDDNDREMVSNTSQISCCSKEFSKIKCMAGREGYCQDVFKESDSPVAKKNEVTPKLRMVARTRIDSATRRE